jgi:D-threo-aldose 1-dehydrogenase
MRSASRRHRQELLDVAFEQGVRHFDVARMYGLGAAERELGRFARSRRDQIAIATKFGIEPSGPAGRLASLQAPARAAVARLPALRARLKRREAAFHGPRRYDAGGARESLETSLRELGTDYVDLLFVHDPGPGDRIEMAELAEELERLRCSGLLRAWGIAGEPDPCIGLSESVEAPIVLQVRDDIFSGTRRLEHDPPAITFGVLSAAVGRVVGHVRDSPRRRSDWSSEVGEDCGEPDAVASLLLADALDRNREGTVLFSTTRPERVLSAAAAAEPSAVCGRAEALAAFRRLVSSELRSEGRGGG